MDQTLFSQALENLKKNPQDSIDSWKSYLKKHPQSYSAHNNLGVAHIYNNNLKSAIKAFKKSIKIHPKNKRAKRNLFWAERRWANLREKEWATLNDKEEPKISSEEIGEMKTYKPLEEVLPEGDSSSVRAFEPEVVKGAANSR